MRIAVTLTTLVVLLAVGCSSGDETLETGPGTPAPVPGGGPGPLFVSIEAGGGFVPVGHDFRTPPRAVIYDDGTTFAPGAVAEIFPGPAVLPVLEGKLAHAQLEEIAEAAAEAGLAGGDPPDLGDPPIADATTTTVTIVLDGAAHVMSVYALGIMSGLGGSTPGITQEQQVARDRIQAFVDRVASAVVDSTTGDHQPERYRLLPLEPRSKGGAIEADEVRWPLDGVELQAMTCTAVTGDQAGTLRQALDGASEITRWRTASDQVFSVVVRPLLPHEPDCPESNGPDAP